MTIFDIRNIRGWRRIVETLKQGPNFGIHGLTRENLESILSSAPCPKFRKTFYVPVYYVPAHYFAVDSGAKEFPDEEFYNRLWASIDVAVGYSRAVKKAEGGVAIFSGNPCLLLGIQKTGVHEGFTKAEELHEYAVNLSSFCNEGGREQRTFGFAHDFDRDFYELCGLIVSDAELSMINRNLNGLVQYKGPYGGIASEYFVRAEIITRMIRKIARKIESVK